MDLLASINKNIKQQISNAIFDGIEINAVQDRRENQFIVYPLEWGRMWAYIDTNVAKYLSGTDCIVIPVRRGIWPFILVLDKSNRILFTLMRRDRYLALQKTWQSKSYHYLDILVCRYNDDLDGQQLSLEFPGVHQDKYTQEELQTELEKLMAGYIDDIDKHVLVCFDRQEDVVLSINAYLLASPNLSIAAQENWTEFGRSKNKGSIETKWDPDSDKGSKSELPLVGLKKESA